MNLFGWNFVDDIFNCRVLETKCCNFNQIWIEFVAQYPSTISQRWFSSGITLTNHDLLPYVCICITIPQSSMCSFAFDLYQINPVAWTYHLLRQLSFDKQWFSCQSTSILFNLWHIPPLVDGASTRGTTLVIRFPAYTSTVVLIWSSNFQWGNYG